MLKRAVIIVLAFLVLAGIVGGFVYFQYVVKPQMVAGFMAAGAPPPTPVAAEPARTESWEPQLPAIGTIVATQQVEVAAQQSGLVTRIRFESGQDVETGTVLVELDDSVEQAELKSAEATLRDKQRDLDRSAELVQRGTVSKTSYDAAIAARDVAAAEAEQVRTIIAQKRIKAPFAGRLGIRSVDLGKYVSAGTTMVTLQHLDPVFVDFYVPEQNIGRLAEGQAIRVRVDAFPATPFVGRIATLDARVDQSTRNVLVRGEVANPQKLLLPGMYADVVISAGSAQPVVTVPRTAVSYSLHGDSVYVVEAAKPAAGDAPAGQVLAQRFVVVGETRGARVAIAEGVRDGETVVTQGQIKLRPGMPVTIDDKAGLTVPAERPKP